jgi:oligosaccharide reducing-end xylanase
MRRGQVCAGACACAVALAACQTTVDSLGYDDTESTVLHPLTKPASYPNPFRDLLGHTDADISTKIDAVFTQLFHGDPATQAIYVEVGSDQAYVDDVLHGSEVRTEGMGLGMLIAVELDKTDEFNRLWTYSKTMLEEASGANQGYFRSFCDPSDGSTPTPCLDPFGFEQFVMALLLANDRWGSTGSINYGADALGLFHTLRHKEDDNGGVVDGVTDTFDATAMLAFDLPDVSAAGETRPAIEMPGYYNLWAQATADPFWTGAASAGRTFWQAAANGTTGFMPVRAQFSGTPLPTWNTFVPEGYRAQINVAIDQIWGGGAAWNVTESNRLLSFFSSQGINTYGTSYTLDGTTCLNTAREPSLLVANGISALASTNGDRSGYVSAVWSMDTPTGTSRYYAGILELVGLLMLGGQFQVY